MANQDFFLSPDEAQTLGNVNYMRKAVRVRHTFPKNLKNPQGFEVVKEISSIAANSATNVQARNVEREENSNSNIWATSVNSKNQPTQSSSNMEMFRNMARKIGKR